MDGFTYQQHSFLIDDPNLVPPNNTSMFSQFYPHQSYDERTNMNFIDNSSLMADYKHENCGDQFITTGVITNNIRKNKGRDGNSSTSSQQLKEGKEVQSKKQRKRNSVMKDSEENKAENDENNNKKLLKEAPAGFIHVRARRGQATDSHSLAERVRREKISERMKVLQALVPGCDKVTGKALMLEEIINYVQSLQYQVEFLSLKIASLNPNFYDLGLDMDALMMTPDLQNLANYSLDV